MYSQFCRDVASFGAIVIAIEHEDGSGVYATSASSGEPIPYVFPPEDANVVEFRLPFLEAHALEIAAAAAAIKQAILHDTHGGGTPVDALMRRVLKCGDADSLLLIGHSFG